MCIINLTHKLTEYHYAQDLIASVEISDGHKDERLLENHQINVFTSFGMTNLCPASVLS